MNYLRAGWAVGCSFATLLGCTEALQVGNEPVQTSETGGSGGATTTTTTTTTIKATGGSAGATATTIADGGTPVTMADCFDDVPITEQQLDDISSAACNAWAVELEMVPIKLGLVVDASTSMAEPAAGSGASKWDVLRSALADVLLGSTANIGLRPSASVGLLPYPNQANDTATSTIPTDVSACLNVGAMTPAQPLGSYAATSHRSLLRQHLGEAVLGRGTPTHDAYDHAIHNMLLTSESAAIPEERSLLLVTDGSPSYYKGCYNPSGQMQELPGDPILTSVQYAQSLGIKTFVIGLPGSESARSWLSQAAYLGGTAAANCAPNDPIGPYCHHDLTQAADFGLALRALLEEMILPIGNCRFSLPTESADGTLPVDLSRMTPIVAFADGSVRRLPNNTSAPADCSTGYRLVGSEALVINRNACQQLYGAGATLQIIYGCTPEELAGAVQ